MKTMRPLTDKIVAEHMPTRTSACTCGGMRLGEYYPRHMAEVTEAAVREHIEAEIGRARSLIKGANREAWSERAGMNIAAKIARGGAA